MHGKPRRIAYRGFSLWPAGPLVKDTDEGRAAFKQTQKQQLDHMWDQTQALDCGFSVDRLLASIHMRELRRSLEIQLYPRPHSVA